jgi:hypothetical protein
VVFIYIMVLPSTHQHLRWSHAGVVPVTAAVSSCSLANSNNHYS